MAATARREDRFHLKEGVTSADVEHYEYRRPFQRDRDRILYSAALRRMAGVTQVVPALEGPGYHNRLTHSLKVAQIGGRLAEYLLEHDPDGATALGGIDPDVVEVAALAHDLGHPPFGHVAEKALDELITSKYSSEGFEGNPQSFRIVTNVAIKSYKYPGLNLTRASLNAILKYPWSRSHTGREHRKWGFYQTEQEYFDFARELMPAGSKQKCLEAEIMDWADDVAYAVHDLEDFYRSGYIPLDQIVQKTQTREDFLDSEQVRRVISERRASRSDAESFFDSLYDSKGLFFPESLMLPFRKTHRQIADLHGLASLLITRYLRVKPEEVGGRPPISLSDDAGHSKFTIENSIRLEVDLLKALSRVYIIDSPGLRARQEGQKRVVCDLFERLFESACDDHGIIPPPYDGFSKEISAKLSSGELDREDAQHQRVRLVADIIASQSEVQAVELHDALVGRKALAGPLR